MGAIGEGECVVIGPGAPECGLLGMQAVMFWFDPRVCALLNYGALPIFGVSASPLVGIPLIAPLRCDTWRDFLSRTPFWVSATARVRLLRSHKFFLIYSCTVALVQ